MSAAAIAERNARTALALVEALLLIDESFDLMPSTIAKLAFLDRVSAFCRDYNDAIEAA